MANRKDITAMFNGLEGTEDLFKDELPDELSLEAAEVQPEMNEDEYKKWLEEGIKSQKGYGSKGELEGTISEEEFQNYYKSTDYSYQMQCDTTAQMISALKEKDNQKAERDHLILSALPMGFKADKKDYIFDQLMSVVAYLFSFMIGVAIGAPLGASAGEMFLLGSIMGIIGTFIKFNGVQNYPIEETIPTLLLPGWIAVYMLFMWVGQLIGIAYASPVRIAFYIVFLIYIIFHFDREYKYDSKMARTLIIKYAVIMMLIIFVPVILMTIKDMLQRSAIEEHLIPGNNNPVELLFLLY